MYLLSWRFLIEDLFLGVNSPPLVGVDPITTFIFRPNSLIICLFGIQPTYSFISHGDVPVWSCIILQCILRIGNYSLVFSHINLLAYWSISAGSMFSLPFPTGKFDNGVVNVRPFRFPSHLGRACSNRCRRHFIQISWSLVTLACADSHHKFGSGFALEMSDLVLLGHVPFFI